MTADVSDMTIHGHVLHATPHLLHVQVILMSGVHPEVLHAQNTNIYQQPMKKLHFVVGRRGKHELMAVGGKWEACDGAHPERDPRALIKTAARAFKEATGVDLSKCTKW